MSTAKSLQLPTSRPVRFEYMIKINDYDRVTSFLIALNMLMAMAVAILLLIWLSTIDIQRIAPIPVVMVPPKPPGDNPKGYEEDVEAPGLEEVQDFTEPRIEETFLAVTDLVTATSGALVALNTKGIQNTCKTSNVESCNVDSPTVTVILTATTAGPTG